MKTHEYVGWALITAAALLFIFGVTEVVWADSTPLDLIPVSALLVGLLVIPGVIILKKNWSDLASITSGAISLILFYLLIIHSGDLAAKVVRDHQESMLLTLSAALICVLPFLIPIWLHRKLKPRIESLLPKSK
jgi:hypothetical protein